MKPIVLSFFAAVLAAGAADAQAGPAAADEVPSIHLGVLPVLNAAGGRVGLASVEGAVSSSAVEAAHARGADVALPKVMGGFFDEVTDRRPCPPFETRCLVEIGAAARVQKVLVSVLEPADDRIWLATALFDVASQRIERRERELLPIDSDAVASAVEAQVALTLNTWRPVVREVGGLGSEGERTVVVEAPQATGFVDGLALVRSGLLWSGGVALAAGVAATLLTGAYAGFALGSYYYGGGIVPAVARKSLLTPGSVSAYAAVGGSGVAALGAGLLGGGLLFFVLPEEEGAVAETEVATVATLEARSE